jgi:hypothetical protein
MADNLTDFKLARNSYATFDALTLKQLIRNRLNEGGVFTDQNFEGSNLNAVIDIIALSYHYLLFYLNSTSSQAMFNEATIYENMNRLVKLIGYKPNGFKTSLLSFKATGNENLLAGIYTIPRYSYFTVNGIIYSFARDVTFNKSTNTVEDLTSLYDETLLYQGSFIEYPSQVATGENFETFTIVVKDNITNQPINIDQDSINVYVKDVNTGIYTQFFLTNSLFLENSNSPRYELRYNENGFYEVKFGNNIFGQALNPGDTVYIYYVQSSGTAGIISANQLNGNPLNFYTTPQFNEIAVNVLNGSLNYLNVTEASNISFTNPLASSPPNEAESVDSIRQNAPKTFFSQNRLITEQDFKTFIQKNYNGIIIDSNVVNNKTYIETFIKYFYDLGLTRPNDDPRFLFNEVNFSHSGQDNNVYFFAVPRIKNVDSANKQYFLQNSQKNTILSSMSNLKALNMEIIPQDPIYQAFTLGLAAPGEVLTPEIYRTTFLVIHKNTDLRVDIQTIKNNVNTIFQNYFQPDGCTLGQLISFNSLVTGILSINGVSNFSIRRLLDNGTIITNNGLTLMSFNPNYSDVDIQISSTDIQLPYYKFPFLYNKTILENIIVE